MHRVIEFFNYPDAHYIKDNIWLGNRHSALDKDFLREKKIRVIINCSKNLEFTDKKGIIKIRIPIDDDLRTKSNQDMYNEYLKIIPKLKKYIDKNSNILVHCRAGMQRSASVIAAYLMNYHRYGIDRSINFIRSKRSVAFRPGPNFNIALIMYRNYLKNNINK